MIGLTKSEKYRMGYQVTAIFKISLHSKDYDLLCQIGPPPPKGAGTPEIILV